MVLERKCNYITSNTNSFMYKQAIELIEYVNALISIEMSEHHTRSLRRIYFDIIF